MAVQWEVAEDERPGRVVRRRVEQATPQLGHLVHAEAHSLRPARTYYYRFVAGGELSPVGRTRTPDSDATPGALTFALASCQSWVGGRYAAYRTMAREDLDLVVHVGDYTYEEEATENRSGNEGIVTTTPTRRGLPDLGELEIEHGLRAPPHSPNTARARSAALGRLHPVDEINPVVEEALHEIGVPLADAYSKLLTDEIIRASDVVIAMGCGDDCPVYPGKRYVDWELDDPAGKTLEQVRPIRDEIDRRVRELLADLIATR